jgi:hypothetical protein
MQKEALEQDKPFRFMSVVSTAVGDDQLVPLYVNAFPALSVAMQNVTVEHTTVT